MAATKESTTQAAAKIDSAVVKQKVSVFDIDAGVDTDVTIEYKRYSAGNESEETLQAAAKLLGKRSEMIDAMLYRATQTSYQQGKATAFSTGNFLTPDVAKKAVTYLQANVESFADVNATDTRRRFVEGLKAKKPGAMKVLKLVSVDQTEFEGL